MIKGQRFRIMSILTPTSHVTPEELLTLPDGKSYELVDGNPK